MEYKTDSKQTDSISQPPPQLNPASGEQLGDDLPSNPPLSTSTVDTNTNNPSSSPSKIRDNATWTTQTNTVPSSSTRYSSVSGSSSSLADLSGHGRQEYAQATSGDERLDICKIVVLGLPWQTEDSTLQHYFSQYGTIEDFQILRERYTGKSRGFGFITFTSSTAAQRAVSVSEHLIDGRRCEAKYALPEGKAGTSRTTRIFIARIPSSVTDIEFRTYFEQFGSVQDAYMPKDPSKRGHRGIGFVTYSSPDAVDSVLSRTHILNGNEVAIDTAAPKDKNNAMPPSMMFSGGSGGSMSHQPNVHMMGDVYNGGVYHHRQQPLHHTAYPQQYHDPYMRAAMDGSMNAPSGRMSSMPPHPPPTMMPGAMNINHPHPHALSMHQRINYPVHGMVQYMHGDHVGMHDVTSQRGAVSSGNQSSSSTTSTPIPIAGNMHGIDASAANVQLLSHHQAQIAANRNTAQGSPRSSSQQHLLNLLQANVAAATAGVGVQSNSNAVDAMKDNANASNSASGQSAQASLSVSPHTSVSHLPHSNPSSNNDLAGLLAQEQIAAAAAWQAGSAVRPAINHAALSRQLSAAAAAAATMHSPLQHQKSPQQLLGPPSARAGPRIFVGKLNRDTSEQDVKDYFAHFGYVLDVYLPRDKANKKEHRGFGFVTFETDASIQRVVSHGAHYIRGSLIAIDSAVPRLEELSTSQQQGSVEAVQQALDALQLDGKG